MKKTVIINLPQQFYENRSIATPNKRQNVPVYHSDEIIFANEILHVTKCNSHSEPRSIPYIHTHGCAGIVCLCTLKRYNSCLMKGAGIAAPLSNVHTTRALKVQTQERMDSRLGWQIKMNCDPAAAGREHVYATTAGTRISCHLTPTYTHKRARACIYVYTQQQQQQRVHKGQSRATPRRCCTRWGVASQSSSRSSLATAQSLRSCITSLHRGERGRERARVNPHA